MTLSSDAPCRCRFSRRPAMHTVYTPAATSSSLPSPLPLRDSLPMHCGLLCATLLLFSLAPLSHAQATSAQRPAADTVKAADTAFRAGSEAYQRNDLRTAHTEFAKVVHL